MNKSKIYLILSMLIFGSIGIFRTYIPIGSATLAFLRGIIGTASILILMLITRKKIDFAAIGKNAFLLILSGIFVGFNWTLLFEACSYTTVSVATLCYYMAPVIVIIVSPILLGEKMTLKKAVCVFVAAIGMVLVSGVLGIGQKPNAKGVLFGLGAAVMYAGIIVCNKKLKEIDSYSRTVVQLLIGAIAVLPYALIKETTDFTALSGVSVILIIVVGVIHTGVAYTLYFGSMDGVSATTTGLFGYIDPAVAVLGSFLILKQPLGIYQIIGIVLILSGSAIAETNLKKKKQK